jgi:ADP-heptose:LPS heptosyltransferase
MGDVAMTIPVILALSRAYPELELMMLSRKRFEPLFHNIPHLKFIEADLDQEHKGFKGLYKLAQVIKEYKIDAVADLHDVLRTKILRSFLIGIRKSVIDKGRRDKKRLINDPKFFEPLQHSTERYADVFRKLGFDITLKSNEFLPTMRLSNEIIKVTGEKCKQWIGVAPFAAHETKSLKVNRAKKLVKQLSAIGDVQILLFGGGESEVKKLRLVAATTSNVVIIAGKLSFEQELNLISNLDAMVAMDSGNGHLASLYSIPTTTMWGNTHPHAGFAPYAQPSENQFTVNRKKFPLVPTSIFGDKKIEGYKKVIQSIKIKEVVKRVKEILGI